LFVLFQQRARIFIGRQLVDWQHSLEQKGAALRARICDGLWFLGIELNKKRNSVSEGAISSAASRVAVRVIRTDEERMIAKTVCRVLGLSGGKKMCHKDEED
jgi:hypothetical protein